MWKKRWAALEKFNPKLTSDTHVLSEPVDLKAIKAEYKHLRLAVDGDEVEVL